MSKRRSKWVSKKFTIASGSAAGDYTLNITTDKGYGNVEGIAFCERQNGLTGTTKHPFLIGLKQAQGEQTFFDPVPKALVLASGEENDQNFLPFEDRYLKMGTQMPASGVEYTVTITTTAVLTEDLVVDVVFKHTNFDVQP